MSITDFRGEYRWLSNFHETEVEWCEHKYPTTEHAYQAAKTTSEEERQKIQDCSTPGRAQRMGQKIAIRADWEHVKVMVMANLTRQKYKNPELREKLLATGLQHLVEGNFWGDKFWGVCAGEGLNHLGRVLMDVREEIKDE